MSDRLDNLFTAFSCASPSQVSCHPAKKKPLAGSIGSIGSMWMCQNHWIETHPNHAGWWLGLWNSQYDGKNKIHVPNHQTACFFYLPAYFHSPPSFSSNHELHSSMVSYCGWKKSCTCWWLLETMKHCKWRGLTGMLPSTHWCRISQPSTVWFMGAATPLPKTNQSLWIPKLCRNKSLQDGAPQL